MINCLTSKESVERMFCRNTGVKDTILLSVINMWNECIEIRLLPIFVYIFNLAVLPFYLLLGNLSFEIVQTNFECVIPSEVILGY